MKYCWDCEEERLGRGVWGNLSRLLPGYRPIVMAMGEGEMEGEGEGGGWWW